MTDITLDDLADRDRTIAKLREQLASSELQRAEIFDACQAHAKEVSVLRVDCRRLLAAASDTGLLRDRCRRAAQMLIQEIGAQGPETLTQTAQRAVDIICALREELKQNNREGDAP
jgi:small-conductance mechanosensitive channel